MTQLQTEGSVGQVRLTIRFYDRPAYSYGEFEEQLARVRSLIVLVGWGAAERGVADGWLPSGMDAGNASRIPDIEVRLVGITYQSPLEIVLEAAGEPAKWGLVAWLSLQATHRLIKQVSRLRVTLSEDEYQFEKWKLQTKQLRGGLPVESVTPKNESEKLLLGAADVVLEEIESSTLEGIESAEESDDPTDYGQSEDQ